MELESGLEDGIEQGMKKGMQQGIEKGMQQGIEQGMQLGLQQRKNSLIKTAKKLIELKIPIEEIIELTELTEEEIKSIK